MAYGEEEKALVQRNDEPASEQVAIVFPPAESVAEALALFREIKKLLVGPDNNDPEKDNLTWHLTPSSDS
jgi:hypothetical protein